MNAFGAAYIAFVISRDSQRATLVRRDSPRQQGLCELRPRLDTVLANYTTQCQTICWSHPYDGRG
jgi:hypothetical protein